MSRPLRATRQSRRPCCFSKAHRRTPCATRSRVKATTAQPARWARCSTCCAGQRQDRSMARGPLKFRQRDVARLVKAASEAGLQVSAVKVDPQTGEITVVTSDVAAQDSADHGGSEWDAVLNGR